jgi:hypothetical protein
MSTRTNTTRRSLLAGLPAAAAMVAPAAPTVLGELPAQPAHDPIHDLIVEYKTLSGAAAAIEDDDEREGQWQAIQDDWWEVVRAIFTTVPTTIAGIAAWLQHIGRHDESFGISLLAHVGHDMRFQGMMERQFMAMAAVLAAERQS